MPKCDEIKFMSLFLLSFLWANHESTMSLEFA